MEEIWTQQAKKICTKLSKLLDAFEVFVIIFIKMLKDVVVMLSYFSADSWKHLF